ncbi:MAG: hypothetical protein ABS939_06355 [Psychrobacillus sp.]
MMKTVKGKVVAGTLALTLFAGAGVAFGASDAGTNLKNWYNSQFAKSTAQIISNTEKDVKERINGLASEYEDLKADASGSIEKTQNDESKDKSNEIDKKSKEYIEAISKKEMEISGYMATQFDLLSFTANGLINEAGKTATKYANNDLTKHTGEKGKNALDELNSELTDATNKASDELNRKIESAKSELQKQLNEETESTTEEIIVKINNTIEELRNSITKKRDDLVVIQQDLITKKATELETQAFAQLDSIVSGINK